MIKSHLYSLAGRTVIPVNDVTGFLDALRSVRAGEVIELANGTYNINNPTMSKSGNADNPIIIRAANRLGARLTGNTDLRITGRYVYVERLDFDNVALHFDDADNCRVTRNRFRDRDVDWVLNVEKTSQSRFDHNEFTKLREKQLSIRSSGHSSSRSAQERITDGQDNLVDYNYFHDSDDGNANGREPMQIGASSSHTYVPMNNVVEYNLFENTINDDEILSNKSSGNTIQFNTFRNCPGSAPVIRMGGGVKFNGNTVINCDRIRVFGDDHEILSNDIQGNVNLEIAAGDAVNDDFASWSRANSHAACRGVTVSGNTANKIRVGYLYSVHDAKNTHVVGNSGTPDLHRSNQSRTDTTTPFTGRMPTAVELFPADVGVNAPDPRENGSVTLSMTPQEGDTLGPDPFTWLVTVTGGQDGDLVEWYVDDIPVLTETGVPYGDSITDRPGFEGWNDPATYRRGPHVLRVKHVPSGKEISANVTMEGGTPGVVLTMTPQEGDVLGPAPFTWLVTVTPDDPGVSVEWYVDDDLVLSETAAPYGDTLTANSTPPGWNHPTRYNSGPRVLKVVETQSGAALSVNVTMDAGTPRP